MVGFGPGLVYGAASGHLYIKVEESTSLGTGDSLARALFKRRKKEKKVKSLERGVRS